MKTTKINHSEILNSLKAQYDNLMKVREEAREAWLEAKQYNEPWYMELWNEYHSTDKEKERIEREIKFHEIMLQEKKYATEWLWSDAHAYEIIEEKNEKVIIVRRMKATIKKEAQKALHDSFVSGGFCGHFDNSLQEWDYESDESFGLETIRKHKDGRWYGCGGRHFTIEAQPREVFDYNF